ncbi:MAG: hypothetical protein ABIJ81_01025 [Patescibacteria group bacterium]
MKSNKTLLIWLIILVVISGSLIFWKYKINNAYHDNNQFYIACGCGCCGGEEPTTQCLYRSQGDDIAKIIAQDKLAAANPQCAFMGCSFPVKYQYCD